MSKHQLLKHWPTPIIVRDVAKFVEFMQFYSRFIPNFEIRITPLCTILCKEYTMQLGSLWTQEVQHTFTDMRHEILKDPCLQRYDHRKLLMLCTDFFSQRIWLHCPTASWRWCISCYHAGEYAREIFWFYDQGLYRYSTSGCIWMPSHAGQQKMPAFSSWWGVCIGLRDKQVPPHGLWAAFCLHHPLLCTEIYLIIWW